MPPQLIKLNLASWGVLMKTNVCVDSCAWNYLFEHQINLAETFPRNDYTLSVTKEVEIEILAIPDKADKQALKAYIAESIATYTVRTTSIFGFAIYEADGNLSKAQVYGNFSSGTFQSANDRLWYNSNEVKNFLVGKTKKKSGLANNQADASIAVRSFKSVVLTNEGRNKKGPLYLAPKQGGRIVYLAEIEKSGLSLKDYVASIVINSWAANESRHNAY
jgi:hypothetical protein